MYTDFYGLKEKPFNLTSSPRLLYLGETHKEALSLLTYGVVERKGFILLTGEIGTGKTTMVRALLANLDDHVEYVYLPNPLLSPEDFLSYLASCVFKRKVHFKSKAEFLVEFENFLTENLRQQRNFILIIDEAQKLSFNLMEEIRLLSNMETTHEKLVNIFLVGQPELNEKLSQSRSRALLQRISVRHHIRPLGLEETREYIGAQLKMAGAVDGSKIFPKKVTKTIYKYSQGYPRMINILADNALLLGYSRGERNITSAIIKDCHLDMNVDVGALKKGRRRRERTGVKKESTASPIRYWKWAALVLAILFAVIANTSNGRDMIGSTISVMAVRLKEVQKAVGARGGRYLQGITERTAPEGEQKIVRVGVKVSSEDINEPEELEQKIDTGESGKIIPIMSAEQIKESENLAGEESEAPWTTVIVKEGDTLAELALNVYGRADEHILDLIHKHNPELKNINLLDVGQKLVFPPLSSSRLALVFTVHIASFKSFKPAFTMFQKLMNEGYEAYIMPTGDTKKGKFFRVALGNFNNQTEAKAYATKVLKNGISDYAKAVRLEAK